MNIVSVLTRTQLEEMFYRYSLKYLKFEKCFDEIEKKYTQNLDDDLDEIPNIILFKTTFVIPSKITFKFIINKLLDLESSNVIMYWILISFHHLITKKNIKYDAYSIHFYVMMLHDIGVKLFEDISFDAYMYLKKLGMKKRDAIMSEMFLMELLLENTTPQQILRSGRIDKKLFKIISKITGEDIKTLIELNEKDKNDSNKFYNIIDDEITDSQDTTDSSVKTDELTTSETELVDISCYHISDIIKKQDEKNTDILIVTD